MRNLIIIPARAGSKGVPSKNVRLFNGQPLICWTIQTALKVKDSHVLVTTDDERIIRICNELGVRSVPRPFDLADDKTTLDSVVYHTVIESERGLAGDFDYVTTLQPTSPLLDAETIEECLSILINDNSVETVMTVVDETHLFWTGDLDSPKPLFQKRVNRQELPKYWRETGSVIACRMELLTRQKSRISPNKIRLVEISPENSIDIDTLGDFYLAQSITLLPRLAFVLVGNSEVGFGHINRCVTLAQTMPCIAMQFYCPQGHELAFDELSKRHYRVETFDCLESLRRQLRTFRPNLILSDQLDTTSEQMDCLKHYGGRKSALVVTFEDLGVGSHDADVVVNELYEFSGSTELHSAKFGWQWYCLRPDFCSSAASLQNESGAKSGSKSIVVSFGGTDPSNYTQGVLECLTQWSRLFDGYDVNIVCGPGYRNIAHLQEWLESHSDLRTSIYVDPRDIWRIFSKATFAITSNGRTVYEFVYLQVPLITLSQNTREEWHTFGKFSGCSLHLGRMELQQESEKVRLMEAVRSLLDERNRQALQNRQRKYDLGNGVGRLKTLITDEFQRWKGTRHGDSGE